MSNATDLDRAGKAKAILDSQTYQDAYKAVREALVTGLELCPMHETAKAEDFRRCLKLLTAVQANMLGALQSGKIAEFRIQQEKGPQANPFRYVKDWLKT